MLFTCVVEVSFKLSTAKAHNHIGQRYLYRTILRKRNPSKFLWILTMKFICMSSFTILNDIQTYWKLYFTVPIKNKETSFLCKKRGGNGLLQPAAIRSLISTEIVPATCRPHSNNKILCIHAFLLHLALHSPDCTWSK